MFKKRHRNIIAGVFSLASGIYFLQDLQKNESISSDFQNTQDSVAVVQPPQEKRYPKKGDVASMHDFLDSLSNLPSIDSADFETGRQIFRIEISDMANGYRILGKHVETLNSYKKALKHTQDFYNAASPSQQNFLKNDLDLLKRKMKQKMDKNTQLKRNDEPRIFNA